MAVLSYLLPPISGAVAFFMGSTSRVRFHGVQSVALGVGWPVLLYGASLLSATATQIVFVLGFIVWIGCLVATLVGRDPRLPWIGGLSDRVSGSAG